MLCSVENLVYHVEIYGVRAPSWHILSGSNGVVAAYVYMASTCAMYWYGNVGKAVTNFGAHRLHICCLSPFLALSWSFKW